MEIIKENNKYNYLREDGSHLSKEWFDYCTTFHNGFSRVKKNNRVNFLKEDGTYLSEDLFDYCDPFINGYARVRKDNNKWNYLKEDGTLLYKDCLYWCYTFYNGYGIIAHNNDRQWNVINNKGDSIYKFDNNNNIEFINDMISFYIIQYYFYKIFLLNKKVIKIKQID